MLKVLGTAVIALTVCCAGHLHAGSLKIRGTDNRRLEMLYICDLNYKPFSQHFNLSNQTLTFANLPDKPLLFTLFFEVPGFGKLRFTAANGGEGFIPHGQSLNAIYECARHRLLAANRIISENSDRPLDKTITARLTKAQDWLTKARESPSGSAQQAEHALTSMSYSGPAAEDLVIAIARDKLKKQGGLKPDQRISTFAYYFDREGEKLNKYFDPAFVAIAANWHWQDMMIPRPDGSFEYNWSVGNMDKTVEKCHRLGKKARAVTGMWMNRLSPWHPEFTPEKILPIQSAYATDMIRRWYPIIDHYQVASELNGSWDKMSQFAPETTVEVLKQLFAETARTQPQALLAVNTNLIFSDDASTHIDRTPRIVGGYEFYQMLDAADVAYNSIVLQVYHNERDIFELDQRLAQFETFKKPVIYELGAFSSNEPQGPGCVHFPQGHRRQTIGLWHRPWDPQLQAEWLEDLFLICMSKEYGFEFCWWDLVDYQDCYLPWGGLIDQNYQPKEAYVRLLELIQQYAANAQGFGNTKETLHTLRTASSQSK